MGQWLKLGKMRIAASRSLGEHRSPLCMDILPPPIREHSPCSTPPMCWSGPGRHVLACGEISTAVFAPCAKPLDRGPPEALGPFPGRPALSTVPNGRPGGNLMCAWRWAGDKSPLCHFWKKAREAWIGAMRSDRKIERENRTLSGHVFRPQAPFSSFHQTVVERSSFCPISSLFSQKPRKPGIPKVACPVPQHHPRSPAYPVIGPSLLCRFCPSDPSHFLPRAPRRRPRGKTDDTRLPRLPRSTSC